MSSYLNLNWVRNPFNSQPNPTEIPTTSEKIPQIISTEQNGDIVNTTIDTSNQASLTQHLPEQLHSLIDGEIKPETPSELPIQIVDLPPKVILEVPDLTKIQQTTQEMVQENTKEHNQNPTLRNLINQPQILSGLLNQSTSIEQQPQGDQPLVIRKSKKIETLNRKIKTSVEQHSKKLQNVENKIAPSLQSIEKLTTKLRKVEQKIETHNRSKKEVRKLNERHAKIEKELNRESKSLDKLSEQKKKLQGKINKHHLSEKKSAE